MMQASNHSKGVVHLLDNPCTACLAQCVLLLHHVTKLCTCQQLGYNVPGETGARTHV